MSKDIEQGFIERESPIDSIESTHYELTRSREYSAEDETGEWIYSTTRLEALGRKWMKETDNELRSERSRAVAALIVDRIAFELAWRTGQLKRMEELWNDSDS